ncbi:MBL fold metallo-hydrolase [Halorubrum lipolyticum]|uniref:Beta-lactamase n=1 Tax=Halorubrum lipolyticum DSM 21995 TaxID=1227482 RepID=M0NXN1_9EURY|nr:MBL fold metallo-hydrolase [Halorubrum lipolyticum]EMA62566.1 beta-lactamase [Halorubrum lipolyticum DSM 21995]
MTGPGSDPHSSVARVPVPVDTRAPGGTTNAHVAGGLLVDPAARTDALDAAAGVADAEPSEGGASPVVEAIAVTHAHPDHVGAVAEYADLTGAPAFAHADHVDRFAAAAGVAPDDTFEDGETVGDTEVRAVETPGHAPDHVAFTVTEGRGGESTAGALLCGDLAVAEGSVVVGAPEGDLREYLDSLERVRDAGYDRLYPGHGPVIDDPRATCDRLIDHRLDRERAVLAAVEGGASDVGAVVDAAYEKDLTGVADLARATVVAHLEKILAEGRLDGEWAGRIRG